MSGYIVIGDEYDVRRYRLDVICQHLRESGDNYRYAGHFIAKEGLPPKEWDYTSRFSDILLRVKAAGLLQDPHPDMVSAVAEAALTWYPKSMGGLFFRDIRENFLMLVNSIDGKFGAAVQEAVQSHDAAREALMLSYQKKIAKDPKPARAHRSLRARRSLSAVEEAESTAAAVEVRQRLIRAGVLKTADQLRA